MFYGAYVYSHNLNDRVSQFIAVIALIITISFYPLLRFQYKLIDESEVYCSVALFILCIGTFIILTRHPRLKCKNLAVYLSEMDRSENIMSVCNI